MADPAVRDKQYLFVEPLGHCEGSERDFEYPNYVITDWFNMSLNIFQGNWDAEVFKRTNKLNLYVLGPVPTYVPKGTNITGNYWSSIPAWPTPQNTDYYLNGDGTLTTTLPTKNGSATYSYNPRDPCPSYGGNNLLVNPCGPQDQTKQVESRADVLKFTSTGPFKTATAMCGKLTATLFVSSDQVDTDFAVSVTDVYPDGQSILLRYGIIRMRWRESAQTLTLMKPGQVYNVTVNLWTTTHILNEGHSLRVLVTSANSPQFDANPNNGNPIADSDQPIHVAQNTVYFGGSQASKVTIPFVSLDDLPVNNNIL